MGFEFEVRVCDSCHESITDEDRAPTATFHDSKHNIVYMHYEPTTGNLLTSGPDKVIKVCRGMSFLLFFIGLDTRRTARSFSSSCGEEREEARGRWVATGLRSEREEES
ncbi:hypothetical protein GOODEAATRI_028083 [Goodea atripinnis]|uniref:Recombination activating protein 1 n=1 Tax=Goodea atripinnis TaxID=208336 RepID=A0ABV0NHJ2_9TELE